MDKLLSLKKKLSNSEIDWYNQAKKLGILDDIKKVTSFLGKFYNNITWAQRIWHIKNESAEIQMCPVCKGNPAKYDKKHGNIYRPCSIICKNKLISQNTKKAIDEDYMEKKKNTFREKYGVDNPMKNKKVVQKMKDTNIKLYGVDNPAKNEKIKKKQKSIIDRYFVEIVLSNEYEFIDRDNEKITLIHKSCGNKFELVRGTFDSRKSFKAELCTKCNPLNLSNPELSLFKFVKEHDSSSKRNISIIDGYRLDVYVKDLHIGFEYNGLYWHSSEFKAKYYHKNKQLDHGKNGIKIINIWEDDWLYRQDIIKSIILGYLGKHDRIYARKCEIVNISKISKEKEKLFFIENHIQGYFPSDICYGLKYEKEIILMMSFKKKSDIWEIMRLCSKLNSQVIGGASRLFKHFIKNNNPEKIITYCDSSMFTGKVYKNLGMELEYLTQPSYWYIKGGRNPARIGRQAFQKHKLIQQGYDPKKTESEIMRGRGYYRIFNCGNYKFILNSVNRDI